MKIHIRFLITVALIVAIALPALGADLLNIPLVWKPTDTVSSLDAIDTTAYLKTTFTILPFKDLRSDPAEIGKNIEKRKTGGPRPVTTKDNVPAWLADRVGQVMQEFGIKVMKDGGASNLEADIVKFYVTEESVYKADIGIKFRLKSKDGAVLWEGMTTASASRWGLSYKADNYYESLSDITITAVYNLLKSDSFRQAVEKNSAAAN